MKRLTQDAKLGFWLSAIAAVVALVGAVVVVGSVVLYNVILARQSTMEYQSYKGETEK